MAGNDDGKIADNVDSVLKLSQDELGEFLHTLAIEAGGWARLAEIYEEHVKTDDAAEAVT